MAQACLLPSSFPHLVPYGLSTLDTFSDGPGDPTQFSLTSLLFPFPPHFPPSGTGQTLRAKVECIHKCL